MQKRLRRNKFIYLHNQTKKFIIIATLSIRRNNEKSSENE